MKVRKWQYEDEMAFLIPYFQERKQIRTVADMDMDIIISDEDNKNEERDVGELVEVESSASYAYKYQPMTAEQEDSFTMMDNISSSQYSFVEKEKVRGSEDKVIDAFLASVGATLKTFSPYMQIVAKTKIFNVVSELELQHIRQNEQGIKRKYEQSNLPTTSSNRNDDEHKENQRLSRDVNVTVKEEER